MPELITSSSAFVWQRHPLEAQAPGVQEERPAARPPRLEAIWSITPTGAPTKSFSAFWPASAI